MNQDIEHFKKIVSSNLRSVEQRISEAAGRAGRSRDDVALIAVTKYLDLEHTQAVADLGCTILGESRPQVLWEKARQTSESQIDWHLIGHLQRNKAKRTLPLVSMIHSVDSLRLLQTLHELAEEPSVECRALLEVNVSGDQSKSGFHSTELDEVFALLADWPQVKIEGFMCMGGLTSDESALRKQFSALRTIRDQWKTRTDWDLAQLSMGMSGDFEIAIEEGATMVRVGSVLYEGTR